MGPSRARSTLGWIAVLVVVVGAVAFLATRRDSSDDAPTSDPGSRDEVEGPAGRLASHGRGSLPRVEGDLPYRVGDGARALEGRVLDDATGRGISGATVAWDADARSGTVEGRVTAVADGAFTVPVPGTAVTLRISAPGYGGVSRARVEAERGYEVRLRAVARLAGRVVREGGLPVPGVTVRFQPLYAAGMRGSASAITDAGGAFVLDGLPARGFVVARGGGWIPRAFTRPAAQRPWPNDGRQDLVLAPGETTEIVLEVVRGVQVSGRVLSPDGVGIPGAPVRVAAQDSDADRLEKSPWGEPEAVSGADGAFVVGSLVPEVNYVFWARPEGAAIGVSKPIAGRPDHVVPVEIVVPSPRFLDVSVVESDTKAPLPGARVTLGRRGSGALPAHDDREWTTGPDGTARVGPLGAEEQEVSARLTGYQQLYATSSPPPTPEGAPVRVGLSKRARLSGRVVFPDGGPTPAALVTVEDAEGVEGGSDGHTLRTRADGTFSTRDVSPAPHRIRVEAERQGVAWYAESTVDDESTPRLVTLALDTADRTPRPRTKFSTRIRLRVEDPEGRPVPQARAASSSGQAAVREGTASISVSSLGPDRISVTLPTDADGFPLPLGPAHLDVEEKRGGDRVVQLPVGRSLEGRVVGPDGAPLPFLLLLAREDSSRGGLTEEPEIHDMVRTDVRGRFRFVSLADSTYRIDPAGACVLLPPSPTVRARAGEGDVVLRMRTASTADVTVVDETGAPVAGATATVSALRWRTTRSTRSSVCELILDTIATATTDESGVARLEALDPDVGGLSLDVLPPMTRRGLARGSVERWQVGSTRLALRALGSLSGQVLEEGGRPVPRGTVVVRGERLHELRGTDEKGKFQWNDLPVGEYELVAVHDSQRAPARDAPVVRARTGAVDVTLTLGRGASLDVHVEGAARGSGTTGVLWPESEVDPVGAQANADADGVLRFRGLVVGTPYALWVCVPFGGRTRVERGLLPRAEEYAVRLEPGASIAGRWTVPVPVGKASVEARTTGPFRRVEGRIDGDRFVVEGLSDGPWTIVVRAFGWDTTSWTGEATARAGESVDVVLARTPR